MAVRIDTALLITGGGPAALVVARLASHRNVASVMAGHSSADPTDPPRPVALDAASVDVLGESLGVLSPYLAAAEPPTIDPAVFEHVLKHHCVADMNVTVYDGMSLVEGDGRSGVLADARSRWEVVADLYVDADTMPVELNAAIAAAAAALDAVG